MELLSDALAACPLWGRTALLAGAGTLGAAALGLPVGWALARGGRGRRLLLGLTLAQAVLPTLLTAIGWIAAFGAQGALFHLPWLYTPAGVALVWACCFWPLPALGAWAGLSRAGAALEEAGLVAFSPWRTAFSVTFPLALPSIQAAAAAAWILMLGDLGVPGCLQVPVGAEAVHAAFSSSWDAGAALAMSLPMLALALPAAFLGWRGFRAAGRGGTGAEGMPSASIPAWLVVLAGLAIPVWGLAGWAMEGGGFSRALGLLGSEGMATLGIAAATGLLAAGLGFALAFAFLRRPLGMGLIATMAVLAFAVPGTLVGAGLIRFWNVEGWRGAIYGSWGILLLAALLRSFAPALLLAWRGVEALPRSYDEAARLCGLPFWRRALDIALPLCGGSLAAAGLLAAVLASGEVATAALVSPPGLQTLACRLFSLIHYGADGTVGALTLMGMAAVVLLGMGASRLRRA